MMPEIAKEKKSKQDVIDAFKATHLPGRAAA